MRKMIGIGIGMLLFPWLVTLIWMGKTQTAAAQTVEETSMEAAEEEEAAEPVGATGSVNRRILISRDGIQTYMDLEEYIPGIIVCQIPADYPLEALKCQAVVARTYLYRLMEGRNEIREEELDLDYIGENQKNIPWSREKTAQYLERCRQAVKETEGLVMVYEEREILPLFHAVSAGRTREGDPEYPYIQSVESRWDTTHPDYLQTTAWSLSEFADKINKIPGAEPVTKDQLPGQIQTVKKDDAGYVLEMKIGVKTYSGEEIQYALGLSSGCMSLDGDESSIQATVKGIGHGYGLSQAGASAMAEEGWGYEEILNYYYKNISLISA